MKEASRFNACSGFSRALRGIAAVQRFGIGSRCHGLAYFLILKIKHPRCAIVQFRHRLNPVKRLAILGGESGQAAQFAQRIAQVVAVRVDDGDFHAIFVAVEEQEIRA